MSSACAGVDTNRLADTSATEARIVLIGLMRMVSLLILRLCFPIIGPEGAGRATGACEEGSDPEPSRSNLPGLIGLYGRLSEYRGS